MGVTGLWSILHPCARPIKLETLNRKRLAVDASIWIYQFLKAVRDKEGNALRNSHVVGFFRRICKLLFFGIKPVFVFDGGAPVLKRQTVSERKKRREGRREDAVRTAGRLLAVQMQRRAEDDERKRKESQRAIRNEEEVVPDEGLVYVDEIHMTQQERQQNRTFRKKDAYHLPDLSVSMNEMGGPSDPRVMSLEELQAYARQFETGEDINVYDFSKIDFDSTFFVSLPASDRYNILNAARLRSRLRMGHSKEQLDTMFPDRMAFSRFQIERVRERNELTQRLMHLNESGDTLFNTGGRVAGEKGREYVLVKNEGVEGGWALGVISDEGTKQETAIDLDKPAPVPQQDEAEWEDEDDFEDVPIEGLNRLPRRKDGAERDKFSKQREELYNSRKVRTKRRPKRKHDRNALFVTDDQVDDDEDGEWEDAGHDAELFGESEIESANDDEEELQRAIALSLETDTTGAAADAASDDDMLEVFQQTAVAEAKTLPRGTGRVIANVVNKRAFEAAPESREVTSFGVPAPKSEDESEDEDDDTMDLQAALAETRRSKRKVTPPTRQTVPLASVPRDSARNVAKQAGFSGPLPFEKLDLGTSLLGKKKMQEQSEKAAGGFENPELASKKATKSAEPLPPWFSGDLEKDIRMQNALEDEDRQKVEAFDRQFQFQRRDETLRRNDTNEVIDLEADDHSQDGVPVATILTVDSDDESQVDHIDGTVLFDPEFRMGDAADKIRMEPPLGNPPNRPEPTPPPKQPHQEPMQHEEVLAVESAAGQRSLAVTNVDENSTMQPDFATRTNSDVDEEKEALDWSDSEAEDKNREQTSQAGAEPKTKDITEEITEENSRSPSVEFEDVDMTNAHKSDLTQQPPKPSEFPNELADPVPAPASGLADEYIEEGEQAEFDDFSDPEDEELLHALAQEAEEHARFASTLNNKTQAQNVADYEKELKQLRTQQKKDRRDADEITQVMIQECQELLKHFGLPYVTAPMEAEAQCAELVRLGLVDGIVTDDSDCFLFGGTRIYKNMFNQAKFVECYLNSDLEKEFDLTREKLIQVAHLLGSDYTDGLPGVGPVTALEILGEFQTLDEFKTWWGGVQMNTIPKSEDAGKSFRKKFRRNATKLFLPPTFPDTRVDVAYLHPQVDSDPQPFQWGLPDLIALRRFLMSTIGWSEERTDEVLVPVIRDMNRRVDEGTQSNITAFFDGGVGIGAAGAQKNRPNAGGDAFAPRKKVQESSKRMGTALSRMAEKAKSKHLHSDLSPDHTATKKADDRLYEDHGPRALAAAKKRHASEHTDTSSDEASEFEEPKKKKRTRKAQVPRSNKTEV